MALKTHSGSERYHVAQSYVQSLDQVVQHEEELSEFTAKALPDWFGDYENLLSSDSNLFHSVSLFPDRRPCL